MINAFLVLLLTLFGALGIMFIGWGELFWGVFILIVSVIDIIQGLVGIARGE